MHACMLCHLFPVCCSARHVALLRCCPLPSRTWRSPERRLYGWYPRQHHAHAKPPRQVTAGKLFLQGALPALHSRTYLLPCAASLFGTGVDARSMTLPRHRPGSWVTPADPAEPPAGASCLSSPAATLLLQCNRCVPAPLLPLCLLACLLVWALSIRNGTCDTDPLWLFRAVLLAIVLSLGQGTCLPAMRARCPSPLCR